jgi:hypothetical protein
MTRDDRRRGRHKGGVGCVQPATAAMPPALPLPQPEPLPLPPPPPLLTLHLKPYLQLGTRQQKRRRSLGACALLALNGPEALAEFASDIAVDLGGTTQPPAQPAPASHQGEIVLQNAERLFAGLPAHSPARRQLVGELVEGLPVQDAAVLAACSERTVQRARQEKKDEEDNGHLFAKHKAHTKRPQRIPAEERKATEQWLGEKCPVKSGTKYHIQRCTSMQLYDEYRTSIAKGELTWRMVNGEAAEPRSRCVFDRMKKERKIRVATAYDGNFDCLLCKAIPEEVKHQAALQGQWESAVAKKDDTVAKLYVELEAATRRVKKLREHEALWRHQAAYLHHVRYEATRNDPTRALIVMDFSKFNTKPNVSDRAAIEWIHDLVMVLEWWPTKEQEEKEREEKAESKEEKIEGGKTKKKKHKHSGGTGPGLEPQEERSIMYVDNLCDSPGVEKNDVEYVRAGLRRLIAGGQLDRFQRIDLFSDGGGKHFKNVYAMELMSGWVDMWHELRGERLPVPRLYWTVTAPHHGHGSADGHAAAISRALRREQIGSQHAGTGTAPPASAEALKAMIQQKLSSVVPEVFHSIARPEFRTDLESLAGGIKPFFQFTFVPITSHAQNEIDARCCVVFVGQRPAGQAVRTLSQAKQRSSGCGG